MHYGCDLYLLIILRRKNYGKIQLGRPFSNSNII
jgi:hypothetical protein